MTPVRDLRASEWDDVEMVAFDVDGTLYDQRRLRLRMARDLLLDAIAQRSLRTVKMLAAYRRLRETFGATERVDFEPALIGATADATRRSPESVRATVAEWIERRPLAYLSSSRYPRLAELFAGLRRKGKTIGILSDYAADAKLSALGLRADYVVCAGDPGVGVLKPHPRGLETLIGVARVRPTATVLIGDRADRDGLVARRAGARALIRSAKPLAGWQTFARFDDPLFAPLLTA